MKKQQTQKWCIHCGTQLILSDYPSPHPWWHPLANCKNSAAWVSLEASHTSDRTPPEDHKQWQPITTVPIRARILLARPSSKPISYGSRFAIERKVLYTPEDQRSLITDSNYICWRYLDDPKLTPMDYREKIKEEEDHFSNLFRKKEEYWKTRFKELDPNYKPYNQDWAKTWDKFKGEMDAFLKEIKR